MSPLNAVVRPTFRVSACIKWTLVLPGVDSLTMNAAGAASVDPPPVSAQAQAAGLVDLLSVVPDAFIRLRYASTDDFAGQQLYPADARCLVHRNLAGGCAAAAAVLRARGEVLVFWDCYRPNHVQVRMFQDVPNPDWVSRPKESARSHQSGRSVDFTLAVSHYGWPVDMGTGFDDFTPRSHAFATDGVTPAQQANRARLRDAMQAGGLTVYSGEWWHFDGPGAKEPRPILDVPVS